ncbi:MAG: hypothetical protein JXM73_02220 [Anaerolineae bacterium]|nr:hypothetical protein [Anaerolineae bacterium]
MALYYPSFDAIRLAEKLFDEIGKRTPGYEGRVGTSWYWRLPGGILVVTHLDYTVTPERWDVIRAQASTPKAGIFSTADFPFVSYSTSATSPAFIHDMQGKAEWSNRLYFQMGHLINDATHWLGMLHAVAISPQVSPPASFPALSPLERKLVQYAMAELEGCFTIQDLHQAFSDEISRARLSALSQAWENSELLTKRPRRVTYALQLLAEDQLEKT